MAKKVRLDRAVVDRGLAPSRARAQALIMAGAVSVAGRRVEKAGTQVAPEAPIEVRTDPCPYVSRGGLKLQAALDGLGLDPSGAVALDVGASTGGFTDCLLQRGARRVYAVDVGYGQLAWRLRTDERVTNIERANIRHLEPGALPERPTWAVIDCSFISLSKVLPPTLAHLAERARVVALIKPQFEAGRAGVGKGGVVRDLAVRAAAIEATLESARALGLEVEGGLDCPVHGPAGNVEYLASLVRGGGPV